MTARDEQNQLNDDEVIARAVRAYFRRGGEGIPQPSSASQVEEHDGKRWAVLRNVNGLLSVYRVRPNGRLQFVDLHPKSIR